MSEQNTANVVTLYGVTTPFTWTTRAIKPTKKAVERAKAENKPAPAERKLACFRPAFKDAVTIGAFFAAFFTAAENKRAGLGDEIFTNLLKDAAEDATAYALEHDKSGRQSLDENLWCEGLLQEESTEINTSGKAAKLLFPLLQKYVDLSDEVREIDNLPEAERDERATKLGHKDYETLVLALSKMGEERLQLKAKYEELLAKEVSKAADKEAKAKSTPPTPAPIPAPAA